MTKLPDLDKNSMLLSTVWHIARAWLTYRQTDRRMDGQNYHSIRPIQRLHTMRRPVFIPCYYRDRRGYVFLPQFVYYLMGLSDIRITHTLWANFFIYSSARREQRHTKQYSVHVSLYHP